MQPIELFRSMARARAFELVQADLWHRGLISGEMHLGTGEEAIAAGIAAHLEPQDSVALDHRPTPMLTIMGVDPVLMLKEALGRADGLCGGQGGHMHLFSKEHRAGSSGIVGAAGPLAVGMALAGKRLRPGSVAVAFYGDGASNAGMVSEAMNLAGAWAVPVLFVCKDNGWAITTRKADSTSGDLLERARAFGLRAEKIDGADVAAVEEAAGRLLGDMRRKPRPAYLLATCPRLDGHFLGDPMVRMARSPLVAGRETFGRVLSAAVEAGGGLGGRAASLGRMMGSLVLARQASRDDGDDPLVRARKALKKFGAELHRIEREVDAEMHRVLAAVAPEGTP